MVLAILPKPASVINFFSNLASVSISVSLALRSLFLTARSSSSSSTVFCSPFFFSRYLKAAVLFCAFFLSFFSRGQGPTGGVGGFFRWYFFLTPLDSLAMVRRGLDGLTELAGLGTHSGSVSDV